LFVFVGAIFSSILLLSKFIVNGWSNLFSGPTPAYIPDSEFESDITPKLSKSARSNKSNSNKDTSGFSLGDEIKSSNSNKKLQNKVEVISSESDELDSDVDLIDEDDSDESFSHVVVSRRTQSSIGQNGFNIDATAGNNTKNLKSTRAKNKKEVIENKPDFSAFNKPGFDLLTRTEESAPSEDDQELISKSRQIELKLKDFNIQGRVTEVHPGPVITLFEFEPAAGVKVGKIAALQDDLAMSLRASSIRIIAPIPKKGTVGIEVPNKHRDMVRLRDVLEHPEFLVNQNLLNIPLGKDTYGDPVYVDIATMPHLLIAGATGTGKSVSINAVLLSLLYRSSPADLGLILIDPKILELSIYDGIPHLKVPVVTVPKQAKAVLDWAVKEMEKRYRMMQKFGVRNIDGYNRIVQGERDKEKEKEKSSKVVEEITGDIINLDADSILSEGAIDLTSQESTEEDQKILVEEKLEPLPKIVIVVDELADLMLTVGRDIEELITRLAQKARAAGIHLILATQRPSVDVITGLIKANFPARISFRVTSRIDSRTILDSMGAERLLGKGDMLFMSPGSQHLRRIHGAFVSDGEVQKVVDYIKSQAEPNYDQKIMDMCDKALKEDTENTNSGVDGVEEEFDPLYDKAVEIVVQKGQASTSMIQRVFRIGYNRAARIIEMMEREGVIGPMDGIKPREVLVSEIGKSEI
jgi:S-DNA-T family DNA segregation ATPase FtsK/SpoIIIE